MLRLGNIKTVVKWEAAGITLTLSPLYEDKDKAFYDECTIYEKVDGKMVDFNHDDVAYHQKIGRECIHSWEGVVNEKDEPMECTLENIDRFMTIGVARKFVMDHVRSLKLLFKEEELQAKND